MMNRTNGNSWDRKNQRMRPLHWACFPICLTVLLGLLAPLAKADTITKENVAERIVAAKTAADHKALAAYFRAQAAEAAATVKIHQDMKTSYGPVRKFPYDSRWMLNHCQSLVRSYRIAQEGYENLAEEHSQVAKELGGE